MDTKIVNKEGCEHIVHSEEQLKAFLDAGWEVVKEKATSTATKKTSKK